MNDPSPSQAAHTPSQIAAANRAHAAGHGDGPLRTPSQIARDNQLSHHGHEPEHGREPVQVAEEKEPKPGFWANWIKMTREKMGGNAGNDANELARGRVLPDEQLEDNKGRDR